MLLSEFTQSVAGGSTVGVAQSGASPAHGHHQSVDGGLRDVFPFLLESHTELADGDVYAPYILISAKGNRKLRVYMHIQRYVILRTRWINGIYCNLVR